MALTAVAVVGGVVVGTLLSGSRTPAPPALPAPTRHVDEHLDADPTHGPRLTTWALRDAEPMAPGMLDTTGDGWTMIAYIAVNKDGTTLVPETNYLLSPEGQPFVVPPGRPRRLAPHGLAPGELAGGCGRPGRVRARDRPGDG